MDLIGALSTGLSGLNAAQANISVTAGNIANAQTPGYVVRQAVQIASAVGDGSEGVRIAAINRLLDQFVQTQLRTETSGGGYADLQATFYQQLQQVYGQPGSDASLDGIFNKFTTALQALATSPSSTATQVATLNSAQALAQQLNSATAGIQQLRSLADQGIAHDVQQVNDALSQIANANQQLSGGASDATAAALQDGRDAAIDQLAKLIDIRVVSQGNGQVEIFTSSGTQLVGGQAAQLSFTTSGAITATQQWNADPTKSRLSSIRLQFPDGTGTDLVANKVIRSGEIAAYLNQRDNVLVQAQTQLDEFAAQLSKSISDTTTPGAAVTAGTQSGFDTDISGVLPGNSFNLTYTDALNKQHTVTVTRVDDPAALPLPNPDPNNPTIGVNFTGGAASVAAQLNAALGATGLQFSNPGGTTLRVLNDVANTITVNSASTTTTATSLNGGTPALPLFVDGVPPYTGAITSAGAEITGLAGRIAVNTNLLANPSSLVVFQPSTQIGDPTRPSFISNQVANSLRSFTPATGIGGVGAQFQGTLSAYLGAVVSAQGQAASTAQNLQSGQSVVINALKSRFDQTSGVNMDNELSRLLVLQNAYGANARVMTTVKQMLDLLQQM
jgi:flagellar hook-associated protein 1 FlgK